MTSDKKFRGGKSKLIMYDDAWNIEPKEEKSKEDKIIEMVFEYKHTCILVIIVSLSCFLIPVFGYWIFLIDIPELICAFKEIKSKFSL